MKKEIGKKLLSIMLTLALVFTMMPMVPGAVQEVQAADSVVYEITNLNLGAVPNTYPDMTVNCNDESVRVEVRWYDYSTGGMPTILTELDKFKVGMDLKCLVAIYAKDGTIPTGAEVTIDGEAYSISASGTDYLDVIIPIGVVSDVSADVIEVTGLDLNPVVGQVPDTTAECSDKTASIYVYWYQNYNGENVAEITGNIEAGMKAVACLVTIFNPTGIPANVTATINGNNYGIVSRGTKEITYAIPFGTISNQVPDTIEITGLDLDVSAEEVLDTTASANTDKITYEVQWTNDIGDKLTKAEYWSTPKMRLEIRPVEGYTFTSEPKLKVNGTLVEAHRLSDSDGQSLVYIKEFSQIVPPADKVIKEVGISGSDYGRENLVIGNTPVLDYTCLDDRVNFACWYEDDITGNKITKFAAGQQVRLKFEMTPKDGYVFPYDEKVTVYVNGDHVSVHGDSTFKKVIASIPYGVLKYNDIQSLNITDYTKPSPNHAPDTEFGLSDTNVASANFAWTDSNGNSVTKFEAGKTYTCTATFVGKSGHGFSSVANIQLMYKGIPYFTFDQSNYVLTDYNNKLVATATYTIPVDAAEEHIWDAGIITTKPTCVAEGVKTYTCVCGATKTEPVAKSGHSDSSTYIVDNKEATCAEEGYTGDTYCKDCQEKIATGTKIAKTTNHAWDNGVVTKEATATEKGEKTYTCSVCKTTKNEEIPALGAPKVGEEIASEDGSATYKVTEAGENGNSVTYEAPTDKNQATVVVPATVTINNITYNVTTISDTAFAGNKKLTSVTIGDNVTGFSDKTFKGCSNLKTLIIGNGVTSIPANAFKNFKKLTTVKMGTGVKTIGKNAFYGCKKLKNLTIGKNVVTIGDKAFYKCTSLTKVTIPSKVKTIGKSVFEGCKALKTITIGKSVTKIGSKAFYGCSKTKTLTIKSSKLTTKKIGSKAFTKTPKSMTVNVPEKKFKAYKSMFIKCGVNKKAKFRKS